MSVINRRNAFLGWAVWQLGKQAAKRKARSAARRGSSGSSGPKAAGLVATGFAAVAGLVWFWRKRRSNGIPDVP